MDHADVVTVLHSFGDSEGAGRHPIAPVVQGDDGALYGVTVDGGVNSHGTAFRFRLASPDRQQRRALHAKRETAVRSASYNRHTEAAALR